MKEKKYLTLDGNAAAAHIAYMFTEVAAIYPTYTLFAVKTTDTLWSVEFVT